MQRFFYVFFFGLISVGFAWQPLDSLKLAVNQAQTDSLRMQALGHLYQLYFDRQLYWDANQTANEMLEIAENTQSLPDKARAWESLSNALANMFDIKNAIYFADLSLQAWRSLPDTLAMVRVYSLIARCMHIDPRSLDLCLPYLKQYEQLGLNSSDSLLKASMKFELARHLIFFDMNKSLTYFYESLSYFRNSGQYKTLVQMLIMGIQISWHQGDSLNADRYLREYRQTLNEISDTTVILNSLFHLSEAYSNITRYAEGISVCDEIFQKYRPDDLSLKLRGDVYGNMGFIYHTLENFTTAKQYYQEAINSFEAANYPVDVATFKNNLGLLYSEINQPDSAFTYLFDALDLMGKNHNGFGIYNTINSIGTVYYNLEEFEQALEYYKKAMKLEELAPHHTFTRIFKIDVGKTYYQMGEKDKALKYLESGIQRMPFDNANRQYLLTAYDLLSKIYKERKDIAQSLYFLEHYSLLKDSLNQAERSEILVKMSNREELATKEAEIELLKKEKLIQSLALGRRQSMIYTAGILLALISGLVLLIANRYRLKNEAHKKLIVMNNRIHEQNTKIMNDLELAKKLQFSLLPKNYPLIDGINFFGRLIPSESLSGDFYDVFPIDDNHIGFYILDVCGHGVSSALITVFVRDFFETLKDTPQMLKHPDDVLQRLNQKMLDARFENEHFRWYLTMCYGFFNIKESVFTYSSAAHNSVYHIRNHDGIKINNISSPNFAIGWFPYAEYPVNQIHLQASDKILMLTDGVIEAERSETDEQFGAERLFESITQSLQEMKKRNLETDYLLERLRKDVTVFSGKEQPSDDITMFLMELEDIHL